MTGASITPLKRRPKLRLVVDGPWCAVCHAPTGMPCSYPDCPEKQSALCQHLFGD